MDEEPRPKTLPAFYEPFQWPAGRSIALRSRPGALNVDLVDVLEQRQTCRSFTGSVDDEMLGDFLWLACRNRSSRPSPYGVDQESRVHPSAGSMHPTHTLVARSCTAWMRYDPTRHQLTEVCGSEGSAHRTNSAAADLIDLGRGALLMLVAEPGKTAAKYENPDSLVWRDAGVVLGYMSLVAQALGLAFCPLGLTGHPHGIEDWAEPGRLQAVALAVLGVIESP